MRKPPKEAPGFSRGEHVTTNHTTAFSTSTTAIAATGTNIESGR